MKWKRMKTWGRKWKGKDAMNLNWPRTSNCLPHVWSLKNLCHHVVQHLMQKTRERNGCNNMNTRALYYYMWIRGPFARISWLFARVIQVRLLKGRSNLLGLDWALNQSRGLGSWHPRENGRSNSTFSHKIMVAGLYTRLRSILQNDP